MNFYDYIEVQPASACSHLIGEDKKFHSVMNIMVTFQDQLKLAKSMGKLVCATGDVHNLRPEDLIYRKVIVHQKN